MNWLEDILLRFAGQYYYEGALDGSFKENKDTIDPSKEEVKTKLLALIEQAKEKDLPLTWLTKQIGEL